jgi:hypothetical protein
MLQCSTPAIFPLQLQCSKNYVLFSSNYLGCDMTDNISAGAAGGPRSRVWARSTLRSAPHQHQLKSFGGCVCKVSFLSPTPQKSYSKFWNPMTTFKIPPLSTQNLHTAGVPIFFCIGILIFLLVRSPCSQSVYLNLGTIYYHLISRVVRGKMVLGGNGSFLWRCLMFGWKIAQKLQRKCIFYDPMLRWCITCAWAWKKTIKIKWKITKKINFEMVSNLSKF